MTKPKYLSQKKLMKIARKVVKGKENYNYRGNHVACAYVENGMPSCLVGQILIDFDSELKEVLRLQNNVPIETLFNQYSNFNTKIDAHPKTIEALRIMQTKQDLGLPWGDALKAGLSVFKSSSK